MAIDHPFYPIIFIRGYAISQDEVVNTVADPYMGFNIGSTKIRQSWTGAIERHYFESPLVRLMKKYDYRDVYEGGEALPAGEAFRPKSVVIYRYYDQVSEAFSTGKRREIESFAIGLGRLILQLRDHVTADDASDASDGPRFRVYLVAHSMGGLIARCLLQNAKLGSNSAERERLAEARRLVNKVFTYATPHNGIDLRLIGNVPGLFAFNNADNFDRDRMREYLAIPESEPDDESTKSLANLGGAFDPDRFFCLVGTNHRDYGVGLGAVRGIVGPMSDGLVRIRNATVWDRRPDGSKRRAPRAFVHRSHSGHYGIVNSEGGYQNLVRFFFGNVRVDGRLVVEDITLPPALQRAIKAGRRVRASYHFETIVRVRGERWDLHRRLVDEESAIFRTYDDLFNTDPPRHPHLFSAYLSSHHIVNRRRRSLGFCVDLGVRVPEYEIDRRWWFDSHFDGGYIYRDKVNLEAVPPDEKHPRWRLKYGFDSRTPNRATRYATAESSADDWTEFRIPLKSNPHDPKMIASLMLRATPWNAE